MPDDGELPKQGVEEYLGDGLYASFDGWIVWLRAPREDRDHLVALDPDTYRALRNWVRRHAMLAGHLGEKLDAQS